MGRYAVSPIAYEMRVLSKHGKNHNTEQ